MNQHPFNVQVNGDRVDTGMYVGSRGYKPDPYLEGKFGARTGPVVAEQPRQSNQQQFLDAENKLINLLMSKREGCQPLIDEFTRTREGQELLRLQQMMMNYIAQNAHRIL